MGNVKYSIELASAPSEFSQLRMLRTGYMWVQPKSPLLLKLSLDYYALNFILFNLDINFKKEKSTLPASQYLETYLNAILWFTKWHLSAQLPQ